MQRFNSRRKQDSIELTKLQFEIDDSQCVVESGEFALRWIDTETI